MPRATFLSLLLSSTVHLASSALSVRRSHIIRTSHWLVPAPVLEPAVPSGACKGSSQRKGRRISVPLLRENSISTSAGFPVAAPGAPTSRAFLWPSTLIVALYTGV